MAIPFFMLKFACMITDNDNFNQRYKRHLMLPQVGEDGQRKLCGSSIAIIGAGGLGSPVALYLAAAGVGHLRIIDSDRVDLSNLQRQIIHSANDIGKEKVVSAKEKLAAINPDVKVESVFEYFSRENAASMLDGCDLAIDATDNLESKFLINDSCVGLNMPFVHGAINQFSGNVMTVLPGTATLRDLFPTPPADMKASSSYGVLGVIPGIIGSIQAAEALKYLLGIGELLVNKVLTFDALTMTFCKFNIYPR